MDHKVLWDQIKSEALPALRADKHIAKPIGGGQKVHFYLKDGVVVSGDGTEVDKVEE